MHQFIKKNPFLAQKSSLQVPPAGEGTSLQLCRCKLILGGLSITIHQTSQFSSMEANTEQKIAKVSGSMIFILRWLGSRRKYKWTLQLFRMATKVSMVSLSLAQVSVSLSLKVEIGRAGAPTLNAESSVKFFTMGHPKAHVSRRQRF